MTAFEQAIALLRSKGYRDVPQPFGIGSASFNFDGVLTADKSLDLVILQDTTLGDADQLRREMLALGRSLDVMGSRRTLTLVLVGQRLNDDLMAGLAQVCRLLSIGPGADGASLRDALAVLLPLDLPDPANIEGDWMSEVRQRVTDGAPRAVSDYLAAAELGEAGVQQELRRRVERPLSKIVA